MKSVATMTQCELTRLSAGSRVSKMVVWIPTRYAVTNKVLTLREEGEWSQGWRVFLVYNTLDEETVRRLVAQHRRFGPSLCKER